jgi:phosphoadenosine phosphosulfate reductase
VDKEKIAIERLKAASEMSLAYYKQPLVVCLSGGKDSAVIQELALRAEIPVEFLHNHTTADAPETVYFIRREFKRLEELGKDCTVKMPTYKAKPVTMWSLIPQKLMPPTRLMRYCCAVLKETGGAGRFIATGVRWAESSARKKNRAIYEKLSRDAEKRILLNNDNDDKRRLFESCRLQAKRVANPIIDWSDRDVWDFIRDAKVPMNPLYQEGQCRVGCIGCPMAQTKSREAELARWPTYKDAYIRAFDKMLEMRASRDKMDGSWRMGATGRDVFNWWMEYDVLPGQMEFTDEDLEV